MSLSSGEQKLSGRVFLGMDTPGPDEMTIQEMEGKKRLVWDNDTDVEYFDRVRQRAESMAKDIIAKAMKEAENLREQARQEGMQQGLNEGQQQVDQYVAGLTSTMEQTMADLQQQGAAVWQSRQSDIVQLIRLAVDKTLAVEMEQSREESLTALLNEAMDQLESTREMVLACNPADRELLEVLLTNVQATNPSLSGWKLRTSEDITGGVRIETAEGMADNTWDTRWSGVMPILDQLTLRQDPDQPEANEMQDQPQEPAQQLQEEPQQQADSAAGEPQNDADQSGNA